MKKPKIMKTFNIYDEVTPLTKGCDLDEGNARAYGFLNWMLNNFPEKLLIKADEGEFHKLVREFQRQYYPLTNERQTI